MQLLRRRGNVPDEGSLRRHHSAALMTDFADHRDAESPAESGDAAAANDNPSRASASSRPNTPPIQEENSRHKRFSLLRFRNASDSQLSLRAKQQAEKPPPVPRRKCMRAPGSLSARRAPSHEAVLTPREAPEIITTAPTGELAGPKKKPSRMGLVAARLRRSAEIPRDSQYAASASDPPPPVPKNPRKSFAEYKSRPSLAPLEEPSSPPLPVPAMPGANGNPPTFANRQSESSRSDLSSNDRQSHTSPATTPKKSLATNPFFNIRRAKKPPEPLFNLSHLPQKDRTPVEASSSTSLTNISAARPPSVRSGHRSGPPPAAAFLGQGSGTRSDQSSPTRSGFLRGRSSTMSSMGRDSTDDHLLPPTTRTSSSTGRKSFGDLLGLTRLRQNSELSRQGTMTPATPGSSHSKNNSLQLARESIPLPERREDESAAKYLARVEEVLARGIIASTLSKSSDHFSAAVLRSYMRSFSFFEDPMDMAIRKLLMEAELPKETQQIDRCLQAFANRYHECNPGIYSSPDQAYFIAFSLLILHTDVFNKNNKRKMQKSDYLKNTRGEGVFDDVLECFYDNITYTPFIHVEDELDLNGDRSNSKSKRKNLLAGANDPARRAAKEPIDPYTLIIDGNLDALRPNLKDAMLLGNHYNYLGTAPRLDLKNLQETFFRTGVLQIVSARSRPDAFMSERTATNPDDAGPGIVDIKITKVGLLWRKETKKRRTRSPWHEWGAILTGAQLYFFHNTSWVKSLMHQHENHIRSGNEGTPVIFKPPLEEFKPDGLMSTHGAVALHDSAYKKHKNAFLYIRQGGMDEVLLADSEDEMNDWLSKLNYAAAFRTSGVRMRGVVGGNYDGQGRRGIRRQDSSDVTQLIDTPTGQVSVVRGIVDKKEVEDIQAARRSFMGQKIEEAEEKVKVLEKQLDEQLRNARHLQILAPIQPKTREDLLSAAARLSAQLKWTRTEMWREMCHRDILRKDLEEDCLCSPKPTAPKPDLSLSPPDRTHSPTSRGSLSRTNANSVGSGKAAHRPASLRISSAPELSEKSESIGGSSMDQDFATPPQSAAIRPRPSGEELRAGRGSVSGQDEEEPGTPDSPTGSFEETPQPARRRLEVPRPRSASQPGHDHDDVDAEERHLLRQAGLIESRGDKDSDKATVSTVADAAEQGSPADRERADRNKIRRSLQRTLREGAGHLSHHRSRRGREVHASASSEEAKRESILSRGTGSFVVHGKKASVINFGSELQYLPSDDKLRPNKQPQQTDQPLSPTLSNGDDDDFYSAAGDLPEADDDYSRRESTASASTATARSFRELHRKYSSAHASRSVSHSGGRLAIPSDGESEAAVSFSDGRRSPLPLIETEESEDDGPAGENEGAADTAPSGKTRNSPKPEQSQGQLEGEESKGSKAAHRGGAPLQAVNA